MGPDRPQYHLVQGRRRSGCTTKALELAAELEQLHQHRSALLVRTAPERDRLRAAGRGDVWCIEDDYPSRPLYVVDDAHQMRQVDLVRVRATGADLILVTHPAASELWQLLLADFSQYIFLHSPRRRGSPTAELAVEQAASALVRRCEAAAAAGEVPQPGPAAAATSSRGTSVPSWPPRSGPHMLRRGAPTAARCSPLLLLVFVCLLAAMVAKAVWQIRLWDSNGGAL